MKSKRKFYRTVVQVEILSEEPYNESDLEDIREDITNGHCSGRITDVIRNEEKTGEEMASLLKSQGSDTEFFLLTETGEDLEEVDEDEQENS